MQSATPTASAISAGNIAVAPTPGAPAAPPVLRPTGPSQGRDATNGLGPGLPHIAPVFDLTQTNDPTVCAQYMDPEHVALGALLCAQAVQQQWVILAWHWAPRWGGKDFNVADIEGFRVYDMRGGTYTAIDKVSFGTGVRVAMFALPPGDPQATRCFAVRAYRGDLESYDAQTQYCMAGNAPLGLHTTEIPVSVARAIDYWHHSAGFFSLPNCPNNEYLDQGPVGYLHCNREDEMQRAWRTLIWFDLSQLNTAEMRDPIVGAHLRFHRNWTQFCDPSPDDDPDSPFFCAPKAGQQEYQANGSCAQKLMLPTYDWAHSGIEWYLRTGQELADFPASNYLELLMVDYRNGRLDDIAVDVTSAVVGWNSQHDNFGFALAGSDEQMGEEDNRACLSSLSQFVLEVAYYAKD